MAYFFNDINVLINGTPILCENASVSYDNSLQPVYPIGFLGTYNQVPTSAVKNNYQFSYLVRPDLEPNYIILNNLKINVSEKTTIVIGNLSGEGYLDSYSLSCQPNQPTKANVSFVGFELLSGALQVKQSEINKSGDFTGIAHGWTTYLGASGDIQSQSILSLDYNFRVNWEPTFLLGRKNPLQVDFMSATEEIKFTSETFNNLSFSGTNLTDQYINATNSQYLLLFGLDLLSNNNKNNYLVFDITNYKINKTNLTASLNDMVKTEVTATKYY